MQASLLRARLDFVIRAAHNAAAGLTGIAVNTVVLAIAYDHLGLGLALSLVVSTAASTSTNFLLLEGWAYRKRTYASRRISRFAQYSLVNLALLFAKYPLMLVLVHYLRIDTAVSNLISLAGLFALRFAIADRHIFRHRIPQTEADLPATTPSSLTVLEGGHHA